MNKKIFFYIAVLFLIFTNQIHAYKISYQGKAVDASQRRINGTLPIIFSIYTSEFGGSPFWTETINSVNIVNGLFTVELGSVNAINLKFDAQYYLGININNTGELIPRTKLQAAAYSFRAQYSDTSSNLENNAFAEGSMIISDTLTIGGNVIITDNGQIGVGTLIPSEKIDVSGNVKAAAFIGDGSQLTNIQYNALSGDAISGSQVRSLLNTITNDSIATPILFSKIQGDTITKTEVNNQFANIETRIAELESDSVTKSYVELKISNLNSALSNDTAALNAEIQNIKNNVNAETLNIYSRLNTLAADTQTIKTDLLNYKNQVNSETMNIYSRLNTLAADTQTIKTDLSNYKNLVNSETLNIYSRLNTLAADTQTIKTDLSNYKNQVNSETMNIYSRLNTLAADTQTIKTDLLNYKNQVNSETLNIYSRLNTLAVDTQTIKTDLSNYKNKVNSETQNIYARLNTLTNDTNAIKNDLTNFKVLVSNDTSSIVSQLSNKADTPHFHLIADIKDSIPYSRISGIQNTDTSSFVPYSTLNDSFALKANLVSPSFTGDITLPYGVWKSSGNLAIGTSTVSDSLYVYGTFRVRGRNGDTDAIYVDANGDVGMGYISVDKSKLHITGHQATTSIETKDIFTVTRGVTGGVANAKSFSVAVGSFEGGGINTRARADFRLSGTPALSNFYGRITDITVMTMNADGNVGIGNTAPGSKLDVKGTIRLSGSTSGYVGLAPAAAAGSTTYTLPFADGTNGQVLTTNGAGVLAWNTASSSQWTTSAGNIYFQPGNAGIGTTNVTDSLTVYGTLRVKGRTSDTLAIVADNNGNVGIGDGSYGPKLHVTGHLGTPDIAIIETFRLTRPAQSGIKNRNAFGVGVGSFETGLNGRTRVDFIVSDQSGASNDYGNLPNITVMTLNANGNVGIGTTAPSYNLHVNGSVAGTSGYNNLSDARYKKNISSIENASELVSKMRGVSFDWKKEDYKNLNFEDKRQLGLIAQELEEILPEAVSTDNEGYKSIAYSKIIPVLIEAIKEQQKTIDLLKIEIEKIK